MNMNNNTEWHTGFPDKRGLYHCKVDGKETYLIHHCCDMTNKHWWSDSRGFDVVGCEILFENETPLKASEIKNE